MEARADLPARHRLVLAVAGLLLTLRHPALIARFAMKLGYLPNPAAPTRYSKLMFWRKIVDRNPRFVTLTDQLAANAILQSPTSSHGCGGLKTRPISDAVIAA